MKILKKTIRVITILLFFFNNLSSQNFRRIDSLSIHTPFETTLSIDSLVAHCQNHATTDLERVRFYFVWIATHIEYDEKSAGIDKQSAEAVFTNHKAVCSGFSRLLWHLCEQSNIPARYVGGYGKDSTDVSTIQNHAWNIIRVEGQWHPFDVTWASDEWDDEGQILLAPTFENWFMPDANVFQTTHLPYDPAYQLTNQVMSREAFFKNELKKVENIVTTDNLGTDGVNTEGGQSPVLEKDFSLILDEEMALDSLERTWQSYRRGYNFMPTDSVVAVKLVKTQDAKVKRIFGFIQYFSKNDYSNIRQSPTEKLKNGLSKLQELKKPIEDALGSHAELETLPLSADNKRVLQQNHIVYQNLADFTQKAIQELNDEIETRE
jgi:Transglutaminase-like superfamily